MSMCTVQKIHIRAYTVHNIAKSLSYGLTCIGCRRKQTYPDRPSKPFSNFLLSLIIDSDQVMHERDQKQKTLQNFDCLNRPQTAVFHRKKIKALCTQNITETPQWNRPIQTTTFNLSFRSWQTSPSNQLNRPDQSTVTNRDASKRTAPRFYTNTTSCSRQK